ncbi:MAG: hypothetical protein H6918_12705 [Sphingomonadaceae bacterium]|nr:hypothetical protein [Sphingomonadaceae bacterium]
MSPLSIRHIVCSLSAVSLLASANVASAANQSQPWRFQTIGGDCTLMAKFDDGTGIAVTAKTDKNTDMVTLRAFNSAWPKIAGQQDGAIYLSSGEEMKAAVSVGVASGNQMLYGLGYLRNSNLLEKLAGNTSIDIFTAGARRGSYPMGGFAAQLPLLTRCAGWPDVTANVPSQTVSRAAPPPAPVRPAPFPRPAIAQPVGEWTLARGRDGKCEISASYDDGTSFVLFAGPTGNSGNNLLTFYLDNARWNTPSAEREFNGNILFSSGVRRDALAALKKTDIWSDGSAHRTYKLGYIAESTDIAILFSSQSWLEFFDGGTSLGKYSLAGSSAGMAKLRSCAGFGTQSTAKYEQTKQQGAVAKQKLIEIFDQMILADARTWMFNRYDPGSVSNFEITQKDARGDAATIRVYYTYNRGRRGYVDVSMLNGNPSCMRFHDNPIVCKPVY